MQRYTHGVLGIDAITHQAQQPFNEQHSPHLKAVIIKWEHSPFNFAFTCWLISWIDWGKHFGLTKNIPHQTVFICEHMVLYLMSIFIPITQCIVITNPKDSLCSLLKTFFFQFMLYLKTICYYILYSEHDMAVEFWHKCVTRLCFSIYILISLFTGSLNVCYGCYIFNFMHASC